MKKIIFGILSSLAISNVSFAGNDKGNAGDGVFIKDEIVMRDFVKGATFTTIEDNAKFLLAIPDLKALIYELANADVAVAISLKATISI